MEKAILIISAILLYSSAYAGEGAPLPSGTMAVTADGRVSVAPDVCPDVDAMAGADYRPGVDVDGNPVAPADLSRSEASLPLANFPVELAIRLRTKSAGGAPVGDLVLGQIAVRDGHAYFNGAPLDPAGAAALASACKGHKP